MSQENDSDDVDQPNVSNREAYNVVTDIVAGPNLRFKDNLIQAIPILVCLLVATGVGAFAMYDRITGAVLGGFSGLLIGLFGTGTFLMIFRAQI